MEKVEIKLSQFGLEDSDKRRYFIREDGQVEVIKLNANGDRTVLKTLSLNNGYPVIWVVKDGIRKRTAVYVREMVAMAFCGYDLNHKKDANQRIINVDYDKTNNSVDNIKVVTQEEWKAHYKENFARMRGVDRSHNPPNCKLSIDQAKEVKLILKVSKNIPQIAKKFGISVGQVYRIKRGDNWANL